MLRQIIKRRKALAFQVVDYNDILRQFGIEVSDQLRPDMAQSAGYDNFFVFFRFHRVC